MADSQLVAAVNFNGGEFLMPMVRSLLPQLGETGSRLLLFDNCSSDGSADAVEEAFRSSGLVTIERNPSNIGFGRAANLIINRCDCPVAVLVNTDTVVLPGCLGRLLACMDAHPDTAFAGPKLLWPDGSLQSSKRDFPFPLNLARENVPLLRRRTAKYSNHLESGYTDWLVGAMMAVRTAPFRAVGGFSEKYVFFHEETDLQFRLRKRGWRVWFEASAEVVHIGGASTQQVFGGMSMLQQIPGKLLFLQCHGKPSDVFLYRVLMTALQLRRYCAGILPGKRDLRWSRDYIRRALGLLWRKETA
jgi:GT2 family glycosyltransferase